jgi:hypothetical protein
MLVDAYPAKARNFQLHRDFRVAGAYRPQALPPFQSTRPATATRSRSSRRSASTRSTPRS